MENFSKYAMPLGALALKFIGATLPLRSTNTLNFSYGFFSLWGFFLLFFVYLCDLYSVCVGYIT